MQTFLSPAGTLILCKITPIFGFTHLIMNIYFIWTLLKDESSPT